MSRFSFHKCERLAKRPQFEKVMAEGRRKRVSTICTLFMLPNGLNRKRLGIIASKKIGNAVIRNRAKRKIREAFRRIKDRIDPGMDIVVISGKDLVPLSVCTLEEKLSKPLLNRQ
ncbi:Ribonuclease P protein component [hydrothermal vent metagenome]|uniref:Ribonuclease P protein component n=1 Tax=hydrothermal vent metagenome TaxID=652676 RepID=A0A3B1CP74_9ZZZZ